MEVNVLKDGAANLVPVEDPALGEYGAQRASGERGRHSHLPVQHMRAGLADDLLAMLGMHAERNLVGHRPGGQEQRRLASKHLGRARFQPVHGWVFAVNIVANLGLGHCGPHLWRQPRDRVAA
jgi:hypothetical protein